MISAVIPVFRDIFIDFSRYSSVWTFFNFSPYSDKITLVLE